MLQFSHATIIYYFARDKVHRIGENSLKSKAKRAGVLADFSDLTNNARYGYTDIRADGTQSENC